MNRSLYRAKIDPGVTLLLAIQAILCVGFGIVCMLLPDPTYFGGIILLLTGLLVQWIWMRTFYEITDTAVKIQCGPIWWTIPLEDIYGVEKTSSIWLMMGGPHLRLALSQVGLMIRYHRHPGQKWFGLFDPAVLISPIHRDEFIDAIKSARPDLTLTEQGNLRLEEQYCFAGRYLFTPGSVVQVIHGGIPTPQPSVNEDHSWDKGIQR